MTLKTIILAAGNGTRMNSDLPKVLHEIDGKPMINVLLDTVAKVKPDETVVVIGPDAENVKKAVSPNKTVVQTERLGTAHAVLTAKEYLQPFDGSVLILFGDSPLITEKIINNMVEQCNKGTDVVVLGFVPADPARYGRLVLGEQGLNAIVEYKDATEAQRAIKLCNSGFMCVNGKHLLSLLEKVKNENAAKEYYLTDIVSLAKKENLKCDVVIGEASELIGVNTQEELATANEIYKNRIAQAPKSSFQSTGKGF